MMVGDDTHKHKYMCVSVEYVLYKAKLTRRVVCRIGGGSGGVRNLIFIELACYLIIILLKQKV